MRFLAALSAAAIMVIAGFFFGWAMGFVVLGALLLALPILVLVPSRRRRDEPGASGPGSPGYDGRAHVGDEGAR